MWGNVYLSGRKKKIRPDLADRSTVALLGTVAAEALRLREENKRLTAELKAALKRSKPAAEKAAPAGRVEKKPGQRRQALGSGLARFLGARRSSKFSLEFLL